MAHLSIGPVVGVLHGALNRAESIPHDALVTGKQSEQAEDVPSPLVHADLRKVRALNRVLGTVTLSAESFIIRHHTCTGT